MGLGKGPSGGLNPPCIGSSQGAFEEVGSGGRKAGAWREKGDEVWLPSGSVYSHSLQVTLKWDKIIL